MDIGILTTTFTQHTLDGVLDAVAARGIRHVQFDLSAAGVESLPENVAPELASQIRAALQARGITMSAVSGTFNMIHPDAAQRADGLKRLRALAASCEALGTGVITLCTGTRNTASMWRSHPDNQTAEAWSDLRASMKAAARIADEFKVVMAFEPEVNNSVDSASRARRIIDETGSPRIKVVMDGANVFHRGELPRMRDILSQAFELLNGHIALAHAKDLDHDGDAGHLPAGQGVLDYDCYLSLLKNSGYSGPIVLHGLSEAQIDGCVAFLRSKGA